MAYKNLEKDLPAYVLNAFILLAVLSVLTGSYIEV